jgi:plastocyanin
MRRLLKVLLLIGSLFLPRLALANACVSNANGLWSAASSWTSCGGVIPVAADDVTVGHSLILDSAAACAAGGSACGRTLTIGANSSVTAGRGTTFLWINCSTSTFPCINISGTLSGGPGQTLKVGSDGGAATLNPDRVQVNAGGRLSWQGRKVTQGTITKIDQDEATVTNPLLAFGLPTRDMEFEDASSHMLMNATNTQAWANAANCLDNCFAVRFTSGDRAWRWYNTIAPTIGPLVTSIRAEFQSRHNPARDATTLGVGLVADVRKADGYGQAYTTGTACTTATQGGACAANGQFVTGTGTVWNTNIALGSRWFCTSDTQSASRRIIRVIDGTHLVLDSTYGGAGCGAAAAYTVVDDNQPYPFFDHSEHIKVGDTFEVIQPATIQGAVITTGAEPDGSTRAPFTNLDCAVGSTCTFKYTQLKWFGGLAAALDDRDQGIIFRQVDNNQITDNEFTAWASTMLISMKGPDNVEIARNFIHYFAPALGVSNSGHGIVMEDVSVPPTLHTGNSVHDNRFELTNDDPIWKRSPQSGMRIYRNIFKYAGASLVAESLNCVDTLGTAGANGSPQSGQHYYKDDLITDNICENIGSTQTGTGDGQGPGYGSASCFAYRTQGSTGGPGYRLDVGFSRNLVANCQTGGGITWEGTAQAADTLAEYLNNNIAVVGNYISNVAGEGANGTEVLNNFVGQWGLDRQNVRMPAIGDGPCMRVSGNIAVPVDEAITATTYGATEVDRSGFLLPGTYTVNAVNMGSAPTVTISDNVFFSHGAVIHIGDLSGAAMIGNPTVNITNNYLSCELQRGTPSDLTRGIDQWRDHANTGEKSGSWTFNIVSGCVNSNLNVRAFANPPAPTENNNYLINSAVAATGLTPDASDSLSINLGWSPLSFTYDRRNDIADSHGPRSVGVLMNQSWHTPVFPQLAGTTVANLKDSDGDGVADFFDNCPKVPNPTQLDSYGNGVGDACR